MYPVADQNDRDRSTSGRIGASAHRPREDNIRLVRAALRAEYAALNASPLCQLPGVVSLARGQYARKIYPAASAVRALLTQAYAAALEELEYVEDRRAQQVATYLRLARDGVPVTQITRQLGLCSTSFVHRAIQRQAMELVTEAFLRRACQTDGDEIEGREPTSPKKRPL